MRKSIISLAKKLASRGLFEESAMCFAVLKQSDVNSLSDAEWMEKECDHDSAEEQCHVCGKLME